MSARSGPSPNRSSSQGEAPSISSTPPTEPSEALRSPFAGSPLQQRIRHARRIPTLTSPALSASGSAMVTPAATVISPSHAYGSSSSLPTTSAPRIGTSVEKVAPRTLLKASSSGSGGSGGNASAPSWQPTRLTSPYCVLSAAGVQEDFYTSALSWGTDQMALALPQDLVLFHPSRPRQSSSTARVSEAPSGADVYASSAAFSSPRRATSVAMSRVRAVSCFLGLSNGAVELYEGRGDGALHCTAAFAMPEPPTDYLSSLLRSGSDGGSGGPSPSMASARAARAFSLLSSSVSSITCIGTSGRHPWLGAVATSACGLLTLDARQTRPAHRFGSELHPASAASSADGIVPYSSALPSPLSGAAHATSASLSSSGSVTQGDGAGGGSPLHRLQRASAFLRQHDRLCSVSWNASGSLVATGSSGGVVKVWSLSAPQRPLHSFVVDPDCTVKALSFHPERPYELLVGASVGPAGLRTYDLSSATPMLASCGMTAAPVTQAMYDPAGNYAITSAGAPIDLTDLSSSPSPPVSLHPSPRGEGAAPYAGGGGGVRDGSPRWRLPASPAHSGSTVVALLEDTWDDVIGAEGGSSSPPFMSTADLFAGPSTSPTTSAAAAAVTSTTTSRRFNAAASVAHRTPPNALVVWRCGGRRRDTYLRDALLRTDGVDGGGVCSGRDVSDDDAHPLNLTQPFDEYEDTEDAAAAAAAVAAEQQMRHSHVLPLAGERRAGQSCSASRDDGVGGDDDGNTGGGVGLTWSSDGVTAEWVPMTALPGHRARPLLLCAPFAQSSFAGCFASVAAGDDGTIRFWRLFDTSSDATHWQHRRLAQQRSATTQAEIDLFTTPVLR